MLGDDSSSHLFEPHAVTYFVNFVMDHEDSFIIAGYLRVLYRTSYKAHQLISVNKANFRTTTPTLFSNTNILSKG